VRKALDTELSALGDKRLRILTIDGDEFREVLATLKVLGEFQADPRLRSILLDRVVGEAEAVLAPERLVGLADLWIVSERQAVPEGVDRRPPEGTPLKRMAKHRKRLGFDRRARCALVGQISRSARIRWQLVTLVGPVRIRRRCQ